jgi:hypothetical protein
MAGLATAVFCILLGAAVARIPTADLVAVVGTVTVAVLAWSSPKLLGVVLVGAFLVPYTWSPTLRSAPAPVIVLIALPAAGAGALRLLYGGRLRLCVLDYLVVATFASLVVSETITGKGGVLGTQSISHTEATAFLAPYLAFRLILAAWPTVIPRLPDAFVVVGACLSLFAVWEEIRGASPLATSPLNNPQLLQWERSYSRGGGVRAEAVMGHPIALGMFLVIPLLFAFSKRRWTLFAIIALGEALTLSRGPYLAAIITLVLYGLVTRHARRLIVVTAIILGLAVLVSPVRNAVSNSFVAGTREATNANYRSSLLDASLHDLSLWGHPTDQTRELYANSQTVLKDVTSEFALISGDQGAVGLALWVALLAAFGYIIRQARRQKDVLLLALGVILVGEWIGLLTVSLITSFADAFLLTVAMAATRLTTEPAFTPVREASRWTESPETLGQAQLS